MHVLSDPIAQLLGPWAAEPGPWCAVFRVALAVLLAAVIGCITLIPGFIAFPLAASLLRAGAGYTQIAVFVSTLMMVGVATLPLEMQYFGKRAALKRNALSLGAAVITSLMVGVIMK